MSSPWLLASRTQCMNPSAVRDILKVTQQPQVLSLAGGLPSPASFPVEAMACASERVWHRSATQALQYGVSEGLPCLRQWVAQRLSQHGASVQAEQVMITTGSQQGLDLLGKVLLEPGQPVLMEQPTFLGAVQSFAPYQPRWQAWQADEQGASPEGLACGARAAYLVPNFQNPTGRCMSLARRQALVAAAQRLNVPLIEDDPYGDLWYDQPPPPSLVALAPEQVIHLGSFSKVLAPGLRLGYLVWPASQQAGLGARLLQAKQGADLHTSTLDQSLVAELLGLDARPDGPAPTDFNLTRHLQQVRQRYAVQRDAMARALRRHLPGGWRWQSPAGGMFFWLEGPKTVDTSALLPQAVALGVAYVPGAAFHLPIEPGQAPQGRHTLRLSFVTLPESQMEEAVSRLAQALQQAWG